MSRKIENYLCHVGKVSIITQQPTSTCFSIIPDPLCITGKSYTRPTLFYLKVIFFSIIPDPLCFTGKSYTRPNTNTQTPLPNTHTRPCTRPYTRTRESVVTNQTLIMAAGLQGPVAKGRRNSI